jgi:hypothetical protein
LQLRELSTAEWLWVEDPIGFATVLGMCQHSLQWSMASFFLAEVPLGNMMMAENPTLQELQAGKL